MSKQKGNKKATPGPVKGAQHSPEQQERIRAIGTEAQKKIQAGMQAYQERHDDYQRGLDRVAETIETIEPAPTADGDHPIKKVNLLMGLLCAGLFISLFKVVINLTTWPCTDWVRNHPNTLRLQIAYGLVVLLASVSIFVTPWRKWCWGVGIFGVLLFVISIV